MCLTCDVLQLRRCPRSGPAPGTDHELDLDSDIEVETAIRRVRDRNPDTARGALTELVLLMQLRPQEFGPSWELGRRQN